MAMVGIRNNSRKLQFSKNRGVDHAATNLLNALRATANDEPTAKVTYSSPQLSSNYTKDTPLKDCIDSLNKVPTLGDGSPLGTVLRGFKLEVYNKLLKSMDSYTT